MTSGEISGHMAECAAIAEIESGEKVEHSLFDPPPGQSRVRAKVVAFNEVMAKAGGKRGLDETKQGTGRNYDESRRMKKRPLAALEVLVAVAEEEEAKVVAKTLSGADHAAENHEELAKQKGDGACDVRELG
jgi:hypothetical protein